MVTEMFLSGSSCCQMLTRYLPLQCSETSTRSKTADCRFSPRLATSSSPRGSAPWVVLTAAAIVPLSVGILLGLFHDSLRLLKDDDAEGHCSLTDQTPEDQGASNQGGCVVLFTMPFQLAVGVDGPAVESG